MMEEELEWEQLHENCQGSDWDLTFFPMILGSRPWAIEIELLKDKIKDYYHNRKPKKVDEPWENTKLPEKF